ncbi:MAG: hypothetical protein ACLURP_10500 [Ruminococcus sp.]
MEEKDRTLGLRSVVSISVGLVIATSCLVSLGQGSRKYWCGIYRGDGDCLSFKYDHGGIAL